MKRHFILFHFILSTGFGSWSAQAQGQSDHFVLPPGKAIYQPKEFAGQDWYSDTSRYSYRRMSCTDNLAIFWEKGFGNDLAAPPDLEGHPMAVDLENLKYQLERFYLFYRDSLKFVKPGSQSEKYRMMAMIQYYKGGPVGLETIAAMIGEETITIEDVYEPYLMQLGFLSRTPRGRCVTPAAYQHLGIKPPEQLPDSQISLFG